MDGNRDMDRAGASDEDHGVVEIVVIPVPGDPRGVGGVGVGGRDDPDEEGGDKEHETAPSGHHGP